MRNFNDIYEKIYKESYKIIEEKRRAEKMRKFIVFMLIIGIGIMVSNIVPENGWFAMFLSILAAVIYIVSPSKNTYYNIAYKQLVINNFIEEYDSNLKYIYNKGISSDIYSMGEFTKFDKYSSEDYIVGVLSNGKTLQISDVITEVRHRDDEGHTYYVANFCGLFAKVDLDKTINSTTRIRKNELKIFDTNNSLEMDSGEFERIFDVYSEEKVETMQILTLDIMQHIIDFVKETKLIPEFTIKENNIYIRFKNGNINTFEADPFKNPLDYETLKKYFDIINFIETITDEISKNIEESGIQ